MDYTTSIIKHNIKTVMIKNYITRIVSAISPPLFYKISYFHNRGRLPNFNKPKDLSEIWIKKVLDGNVNKLSHLADKYEVRKYVEGKGLKVILSNLLGVYDNPYQINFDTLPDKFAIKLNYGAGMNIICNNKAILNKENAIKQLKKWINGPKYSLSETHYNFIPKKIIIEEYIDDGNGGFPIDYKFMCLNGKAICCLVCAGRESGHADYLPYDLEWNPIFKWSKYPPLEFKPINKPKNFEEMVKIAQELASEIDLVRVDLFSNGSKIWFGEMTLTPSGCIFHRWSNQAMIDMGNIYLNDSI